MENKDYEPPPPKGKQLVTCGNIAALCELFPLDAGTQIDVTSVPARLNYKSEGKNDFSLMTSEISNQPTISEVKMLMQVKKLC